MAIRKINFTVKEDGITPATEQRAGLQNEHGATQLVFNIDDKLYSKLSTVRDNKSLVYRFDCYNSVGGTVRLDTSPLDGAVVTYNVGEYLTRYGGKAAVYLVISVYNDADETELELLSYPARLRFEGVSFTGAEERESPSTLAEAAKKAAERAKTAEVISTTAQGKTEQAQRALESGSEFFFDGGNSSGYARVGLVVDNELSESSENPIENKAVALKFKELSTLIYSAVTAAIAEKNERDHPVGSFFASTENVDPATLYGGTWERIKGRFIYSIDDGETAGVTGGEKTHTLTTDEMPSHVHAPNQWVQVVSPSGNTGTIGQTGNKTGPYKDFVSAQNYNSSAVGGGQAHNNMPPYYGAYVWRRTA